MMNIMSKWSLKGTRLYYTLSRVTVTFTVEDKIPIDDDDGEELSNSLSALMVWNFSFRIDPFFLLFDISEIEFLRGVVPAIRVKASGAFYLAIWLCRYLRVHHVHPKHQRHQADSSQNRSICTCQIISENTFTLQ